MTPSSGATSSWSVAEAQGYRDGEAIPMGFVTELVGRIAAAVKVPVSVDFEGGYSESDDELVENVSRLIELGIVGVNFEDRVVKGAGLYGVERQARRIAAIFSRNSGTPTIPTDTRTPRADSRSTFLTKTTASTSVGWYVAQKVRRSRRQA